MVFLLNLTFFIIHTFSAKVSHFINVKFESLKTFIGTKFGHDISQLWQAHASSRKFCAIAMLFYIPYEATIISAFDSLSHLRFRKETGHQKKVRHT